MSLPKRQAGVICTSFDYPPIPDRNMDWSATFSGYDGAEDANDIIGRGPTELSAIADLLAQEAERNGDELIEEVKRILLDPYKADRAMSQALNEGCGSYKP